jgi:hypothetical protein
MPLRHRTSAASQLAFSLEPVVELGTAGMAALFEQLVRTRGNPLVRRRSSFFGRIRLRGLMSLRSLTHRTLLSSLTARGAPPPRARAAALGRPRSPRAGRRRSTAVSSATADREGRSRREVTGCVMDHCTVGQNDARLSMPGAYAGKYSCFDLLRVSWISRIGASKTPARHDPPIDGVSPVGYTQDSAEDCVVTRSATGPAAPQPPI